MGRLSINENDDWQVEHDQQDIRGWDVQDYSGKTVGRVHDLIADTDSGVVETIVLDTDEEFPTDIIEVGHDDKIVYLASDNAATHMKKGRDSGAKAYRDAAIRKRERSEENGFAHHESAFREHHRTTYGDGDQKYEEYQDAYKMGYVYGTDTGHKDHEWDDVHGEMREDYEKRHGKGTWDRVKDAVRHAFTKSRSGRGTTGTGTTGSSSRATTSKTAIGDTATGKTATGGTSTGKTTTGGTTTGGTTTGGTMTGGTMSS